MQYALESCKTSEQSPVIPSDHLSLSPSRMEQLHKSQRSERLLVGFLLGVVALVLASALTGDYAQVNQQERTRIAAQAELASELVAEQMLAINNLLQGVQREWSGWQQDALRLSVASEHLRILQGIMPGVRTLLVTDAWGVIQQSNRPEMLGRSVYNYDFFMLPRQTADQDLLYVTPPGRNGLEGVWSIAVSRILLTAEGDFGGVVIASLEPQFFSALLASGNYATDMTTWLIHGIGQVFVETPLRAAGLPSVSIPPGLPDRLSVQRMDDDSPVMVRGGGDHADMVYQYHKIKHDLLTMDWSLLVAVGRSRQEIYADWRYKSLIIGIVYLFLVMVSFGVLLVQQRRRQGQFAEQALLESRLENERLRLRGVIKGTQAGIWEWNIQNHVTVFNERWAEIVGLRLADLQPTSIRTWLGLIHPDDLPNNRRVLAEHIRGKRGHYHVECRMRHREGHWVWVLIQGEIQAWTERGKPLLMLGTCLDNSERKEYEEALVESQQSAQLAAMVFNAPSGIMITDAQYRILRVNQEFTQMTGYTLEDCVGRSPSMFRSGRHGPEFYADLFHSLKHKHYWEGEVWNRHKNGDVVPMYVSIQSVLNADGQVIKYIGAYIDISHQKLAEERMKFLLLHDPLTGLANRKHLAETIALSIGDACSCALIFFGLGNLSLINSSFGHEVGDQILVQVAERLRKQLPEAHLLARFGSNEFAVWLIGLNAKAEIAALEAKGWVDAIFALMRPSFVVDGRQISAHIRLGVAIGNAHPVNPAQMIQQANAALHQAKSDAGEPCVFYDGRAETAAREYIEIYEDLLSALNSGYVGLELYYQPQTDRLGRVLGAEALLRWQHPEKGFISPGQFIPVAERSGLILALGDWVIDTACQQLHEWQSHPATAQLGLAVNVSTKQFFQEDFAQKVVNAIQRYAVNPDWLKLELTETTLAGDLDKVSGTMQSLRAYGVRISLDDFGTGYSSMRYLQTLPIQQIKIDQSFVRCLLDEGRHDVAIVRAILSLGEAFGIEAIAEGVETQAQLEALHALGCRYFQGYLFSRPLPAAAFRRYCEDAGFLLSRE